MGRSATGNSSFMPIGLCVTWICICQRRWPSLRRHRGAVPCHPSMCAGQKRRWRENGSMKALQVRIRKIRSTDVRRIIEIERSWPHLSHWSEDSYYRLVNDEGFTASFLAEVDDETGRPFIAGF